MAHDCQLCYSWCEHYMFQMTYIIISKKQLTNVSQLPVMVINYLHVSAFFAVDFSASQ